MRIIPLHKVTDTGLVYFGFTVGNVWFIVRFATVSTTTTITYYSTEVEATYTAGIAAPGGLTYTDTVQAELNLLELFSAI